MMVSGSLGCANFVNTLKAQQRLEEADRQVADGDFKAALKSNAEALEAAPDMFGDRALYQMALTYVHPANPRPDYRESDRTLHKLILDFPESSLKDEANVWRHVLREIAGRDREITKRARKIGKLNKTVAGLEKALENKDADLKKALENKEDEIARLQDRIKEVQAEVFDLKGKIERLKEVDLGVEKNKRKILPQ